MAVRPGDATENCREVLVKIYTGKGDQGMTGLPDGRRVPKNHPRLECCGTIDELNSHLGLAAAQCRQETLRDQLRALQNELLALGADLAAAPDRRGPSAAPRIGPVEAAALEARIDAAAAQLPPLKHFVLPGGSPAAAELHVARTVCRRAERHVAALMRDAAEALDNSALVYLNRMSDLLFLLARLANQADGMKEVEWHGTPGGPDAPAVRAGG
jgi:cob(I)alamin adenosyltransferase